MTSPVHITRRDTALVLAIARPEDGNRIDSATMAALHRGLDAADADASVRSVVLTGSRQHFCSGGRIDGHPDGTVQQQLAFAQAFCTLRQRMGQARVPVIAAVEGHCTAGGMAVLAACDYAIAADDVAFGLPEVGFGLFPLLAMASVYPLLTPKKAMELFYTGRLLYATEALELELVNRAVLPSELWQEVDRFCAGLATMNPTALMIGRKAWHAMEGMAPAARHDYAQTALAALLASGSGAVPH